MRQNLYAACLVLITITTGLYCKKEAALHDAGTANTNSNENAVTSICGNFNYGDSIFYLREQPTDYIINPLKAQRGTYGAFPAGLAIDPLSGAINVSKSETGLRYLVWFAPASGADTCKKFITISGINYVDSIYQLKAGIATLALPVFDANITPATVTAKHGAGEAEAEYDDGPDDDDGDGFADEPPAGQRVIPKGVALNKKTGTINLTQTLANGVFGATPVSGSFKNFILNYRIAADSSKATLNRLTFRMYYFQNKAAIPASLKNELKAKRNLLLFNNSASPQLKISSGTAREKEAKCRPAYIIVVGA